jgi:hypothetical protein
MISVSKNKTKVRFSLLNIPHHVSMNHLFEKCAFLRPKKIIYNPQEPHIIIKLLNSNILGEQTNFVITKDGVINGNDLPVKERVYIGRKFINEDGTFPNHINIHPSNVIVSRVHAAVDVRDFFYNDEFHAASHALDSINKRRMHQLPRVVLKQIFSYIICPSEFHLIDLGTACGTFIGVTGENEVLMNDYYVLSQSIGLGCYPFASLSGVHEGLMLPTVVHVNDAKKHVFNILADDMVQLHLKKPVLLMEKILLADKNSFIKGKLKAYIFTGNPITIKIKDTKRSLRYLFSINYKCSRWYLTPRSTIYKSVSGQKDGSRYTSKSIKISNGGTFKINECLFSISWANEVVDYN